MGETADTDLVTLVNEQDEPVDAVPRVELRRHPGLHFRTAHLFVFDRRGHLLLQRLAAQRDRNPLRWGSSVAAYVRPGESYLDAARRRSGEELGITPSPSLIGITEMPDLRGTKHVALFRAGAGRRQVRIAEPGHIAELRWFSFDRIWDMLATDPVQFTATFVWLFARFFADGEARRTRSA